MLLYLSVIILALVLGASFYKGRSLWVKEKFFKLVFIFTVIAVFAIETYVSKLQYQAWLSGALTMFLLPPYQGISYFLQYVGFRFFGPYVVSFVIAMTILYVTGGFNKKYEERFFYPEEYWIAALSIFLTGHPGWLFYLIVLMVFYLIIHFYYLIVLKEKNVRISLYYLWIPTAIFVILVNGFWLQYVSWMAFLRL